MAVVSGSVVSVYGSGFAASRGVYCAIAGVDSSAAWSYVAGTVMNAGSMACTVPARGAGMQVVEVAIGDAPAIASTFPFNESAASSSELRRTPANSSELQRTPTNSSEHQRDPANSGKLYEF